MGFVAGLHGLDFGPCIQFRRIKEGCTVLHSKFILAEPWLGKLELDQSSVHGRILRWAHSRYSTQYLRKSTTLKRAMHREGRERSLD